MIRTNVLCCAGTGCTASQSGKIYDNFIEQIQKFGLQDEVKVVKTGCFGLCQKGPIVAIYPDKVFYSHVKPEDVERIVSEHLYKGRVVKDLELSDEDRETHEKILEIDKINFYKKQERIALRNCGKINPEDITEYIAMDGYEALGKAVTTMTPQEVIDVMKKSGLRGRGGAGFPTGVKWQFEKDAPGTEKYVICNADEGDPGAFMDRSILEGDPNAVIEGMAIMAYAVGAQKGYIYVRAEYPIAVHRLKIAIKQAEDLNLLGKNIFGSGFNFDIEIRLGAGAFVCGEETALIASIEGQRGMPRPKPHSRLFPVSGASRPASTMSRRLLTFRRSSTRVLTGTLPSVRKSPKEPRSSHSAARSGIPDLSRYRWEPRSVRLSMRSAEAARTTRNSKPFRPAVLPEDA